MPTPNATDNDNDNDNDNDQHFTAPLYASSRVEAKDVQNFSNQIQTKKKHNFWGDFIKFTSVTL